MPDVPHVGDGYVANVAASPGRERDRTPEEAVAAGHLAPDRPPAAVNLQAPWYTVGDQGRTGSCVGWALADSVLEAVAASGAKDAAEGNAAAIGGQTVEAFVNDEAALMGEKVELRTVARVEGTEFAIYLHKTSKDLPPQVGVMVEYDGGDEGFVRGIAMQIAAMSPSYVTREEVPGHVLDNERKIAELTAKEEGKPEAIIPRVVEGRLGGFFKEVCLVEQPSVSDDKLTVGQLLKKNGVEVKRFVRFAAGA